MDFFTLTIAILFVLAVIDLSVGVSNDAVNFLNSAIGSRVASRRTIMIVATFGILVGAMFSSGIMEVARKGIFNPEMFTFADVMVVFLAVMIADVLLLDLFNTFGLPTSTTVSIVFELLGAATAVAIIHVTHNADAAPFIEFINAQNALAIISGIVLSVAVAFTVGTAVQFVSRLLFTFEDGRHSAVARITWSAVALTVITYFLFIKGMKGAGFISGDTLQWVNDNTLAILLGVFAVWLGISLLLRQAGINPLVLVVLAGTFALAMAFASNDLVNFIGVPLAGYESWKAWSVSGMAPEAFHMDVLAQPVQSSNLFLFGAGVIMAVTLWVSAKARTVTQTEVTLARQGEGAERFKPGPVSRSLVRLFVAAGELLQALTPMRVKSEVERRFVREESAARLRDAPAFDLVRASVNLAVASILIAIATYMKLPLSTTFVSFMVAMGTSLADRAWGRDSAAYRVAGVLSVLGGWFLTAAAAFFLAALFAVLLATFGAPMLGLLVVLVAFTLYRSFHYHGARARREERARVLDASDFAHHVPLLQAQMSDLLEQCSRAVELAISALLQGDRALLDQAGRQVALVRDSAARKELQFVRVLKKVKPQLEGDMLDVLETLACQQDLFQSVETVAEAARTHILNAHERPCQGTVELLEAFNRQQRATVSGYARHWAQLQAPGPDAAAAETLLTMLRSIAAAAVRDLYGELRPVKNTTLVLTLVTELADFVREVQRARTLWAQAYTSMPGLSGPTLDDADGVLTPPPPGGPAPRTT
jgi:phosphate/sulfate permease